MATSVPRRLLDWLARVRSEQGAAGLKLAILLGTIVITAAIAVWLNKRAERLDRATRDVTSGTAPGTVGTATTSAPQDAQVATSAAFRETKDQILPEVPQVPALPGADLVGSAVQGAPGAAPEGYRIKWTTSESVPAVLAWYSSALKSQGWTYVPPDDSGPEVEQVARIEKGDLRGYVAAEASGPVTEIVISLQHKKK